MSLTLSTGTSAGKLYVYAFGYNVLRVMAGKPKYAGKSKISKILLVDNIVICDIFKLIGKLLKFQLPSAFRKECRDLCEKQISGKNVGNMHSPNKCKMDNPQPNTYVRYSTRIWWRFNDYNKMGLRGLVHFYDNLRYSLVPCASHFIRAKYTERWGILRWVASIN